MPWIPLLLFPFPASPVSLHSFDGKDKALVILRLPWAVIPRLHSSLLASPRSINPPALHPTGSVPGEVGSFDSSSMGSSAEIKSCEGIQGAVHVSITHLFSPAKQTFFAAGGLVPVNYYGVIFILTLGHSYLLRVKHLSR